MDYPISEGVTMTPEERVEEWNTVFGTGRVWYREDGQLDLEGIFAPEELQKFIRYSETLQELLRVTAMEPGNAAR